MAKCDFKLYLITDRHACRGRALPEVCQQAVKAGVKAIQLREKDLTARAQYDLAWHVKNLSMQQDFRLFINDRVDIAMAISADGVQLTHKSIPAAAARSMVGEHLIIGTSVHSVKEAQLAAKDGSDFLLFGPIFETPSKAGYGAPQGLAELARVTSTVSIPVFAVGGIDPDRACQCLEYGAYGVAVISALLAATDIGESVARFESALNGL